MGASHFGGSPLSKVLPFLRPSAPPSAPPALRNDRHRRERRTFPASTETGGRRGQYGIADLARLLMFPDWTIRTVIEKLRTLARVEGMPLPETPRIVAGKELKGPDAIQYHSRWDAALWDAWHLLRKRTGSGHLPAGASMPAPTVPPPVRASMAQAAERIGGGQ